jgi:hypothetical protein
LLLLVPQPILIKRVLGGSDNVYNIIVVTRKILVIIIATIRFDASSPQSIHTVSEAESK